MPASALQVLTFALLPTAALLLGGGVALWRAPNAAWRSAILHFAAGVVFSVVAVELLPDIVKQHKPLEVALGFGGGVTAMLGLRALMSRLQGAPEKEAAKEEDGASAALDVAPRPATPQVLAPVPSTPVLPLGLLTSVQLRRDGLAVRRVLGILGALSVAFLLGAVGGATLLSGLSGEALELVLSFGLAALLFLVTEELLVEAHEEAETPWLTASFFGGFGLFLLLGMMG